MIFNLRRSATPSHGKRQLEINGRSVSVFLRRNAQARRFILKISRKNSDVILTMPVNGSENDAMEFAASQAHWIQSRIEAQPEIIAFGPGITFPIRGILHTISHRPDQRGTAWIETASDGEEFGLEQAEETSPLICVAGDERHLARRLTDWLKKQARCDLSTSVETHSTALGLSPTRITIRDQSTRWGSCSSTGVLSFSWRLILAPPFVLDYVAAHEVAHLEEMNHGPRFWKLVNDRLPGHKKAQTWLKQNGAELHFYGK